MARPAHETKHLSTLSYPFLTHTFELSQRNDGETNGTALWLGAQCMAAFLADALPSPPRKAIDSKPTPCDCRSKAVPTSCDAQQLATARKSKYRAIELGSGVGMTALALASLGWDVLATDIAPVVNTVLRPNVERNVRLLCEGGSNATSKIELGAVQARELDWTAEPASWSWNDPARVASHEHTERRTRYIVKSEGNKADSLSSPDALLGPPFDLILTSDTLYSAALVEPLLRTLHHLCLSSHTPEDTDQVLSESDSVPDSTSKPLHPKRPFVYLALENRDPGLVASFFAQAKDVWGFSLTRIPQRRVSRAMERSGLRWDKSEWEGVEIWKMQLPLGGRTQAENDKLVTRPHERSS